MYTQEQVDRWFAENPEATPDVVAKTVQQLGGLNSNTGLDKMIASHYGTDQNAVDNYYNNFIGASGLPSTATTQGMSPDKGGTTEVQEATTTGGLPVTGSATNTTNNNQLSGVILAGDSWLAGDEKTNLANTAFGENVTNTAIGGQKTSDVLNQLNQFETNGGTFAPNSTVVLDVGANDIASGVDKNTIRNNLDEIISRLEAKGVKVVLSGAPTADSYADAISRTDLKMDDLYNDVAKNHSNVTLVDAMSGLLNQKDLMDASGFHLKDDASKALFLNQLADAYKGLSPSAQAVVDDKLATVDPNNIVAVAKVVDSVAGTNIAATAADTTATEADTQTSTATKAQSPLVDLYQRTLGRTPTQEEIDSWNFGDTIDAGELDRFLGAARNEAVNTMPTTGAVGDMARQILAQGKTSLWSGEGYGSAEKNAYDMAVMLAGQGLTDINQLGKVTKEVPTYDEDGNQIGTQKVDQFVNKLTGQPINAYYDKAGQIGSDIWGGTFAGSGSTAYGAKFDAQGNPIFYSQYGGSSNDLANLMADLGPLGQIGLAIATGGLSLPEQLAANFAVQVLSGKDIGDAIKNAAVSYAGAQIPGLDAVKEGSAYLNTIDSTGMLSKAFQNAAVSGTKALLTGQDLGNAIIQGATTGGVNGAVSTLMDNVDGFKDLTSAQQKMVTNAVTGIVSGRPLDQVVINAAIAAANAEVAKAKGESGTSGSSSTVSKTAPLSEEEVADLTPEQLAVYQASGTQGLIDYNRAMKKAGTSGATDTSNAADTGTTKSVSGTTADADFVNSEYARLKGLGYTKEQISAYFDKLDALTSGLDLADTGTTGGTANDAGTLTVTGKNVNDTTDTSGLDSVSSKTKGIGGLDTVTVTGKSDKDVADDTNVSDLGNVTITGDKAKDLGTVTITGDKAKDLGTVTVTGDKVTDGADTTVVKNDDDTTTTIVVTADGNVKTHDCAVGYHWDEAAQACVPDTKIETKVVTPTVVTPPPVITKPKTTVASTSPLSGGAGTPIPKLDSSPQFLAGASPQKRMELAKIQQLFASLTPEMAAVLSERGFSPPKYAEDKVAEVPEEKQDKSYFGNLSDELYNPKSKFMASGGSVLDSMMPKFVDTPKTISAAPVVGTGGVDSPLKLTALKHLQQGVGRPMKQLGGLAQGGLPAKYAKAAPKGHNPEFITGLTGYYASGDGTGQSDDIPAMLHDGDYVIDADAVAALGDGSSKAGAEALADFQKKVPHSMATGGEAVPAKIADGEYVFPAAFVTALGGGDNKTGAKRLDAMREELRAHKRSAPTSKIPPKAKSPLDYLRMAKG